MQTNRFPCTSRTSFAEFTTRGNRGSIKHPIGVHQRARSSNGVPVSSSVFHESDTVTDKNLSLNLHVFDAVSLFVSLFPYRKMSERERERERVRAVATELEFYISNRTVTVNTKNELRTIGRKAGATLPAMLNGRLRNVIMR